LIDQTQLCFCASSAPEAQLAQLFGSTQRRLDAALPEIAALRASAALWRAHLTGLLARAVRCLREAWALL
jgi:hypothetical protein